MDPRRGPPLRVNCGQLPQPPPQQLSWNQYICSNATTSYLPGQSTPQSAAWQPVSTDTKHPWPPYQGNPSYTRGYNTFPPQYQSTNFDFLQQCSTTTACSINSPNLRNSAFSEDRSAFSLGTVLDSDTLNAMLKSVRDELAASIASLREKMDKIDDMIRKVEEGA